MTNYPPGWTDKDRADWCEGANESARASLARACDELDAIAGAIEALPSRTKRKLIRASRSLSPSLIRNEAGRGRDTLLVWRRPPHILLGD
jgi:hypothetical protein